MDTEEIKAQYLVPHSLYPKKNKKKKTQVTIAIQEKVYDRDTSMHRA